MNTILHWNGNVVILMKFSSLAASEVVKMTTSSAASGENFIKMTTFWIPHSWLVYHHSYNGQQLNNKKKYIFWYKRCITLLHHLNNWHTLLTHLWQSLMEMSTMEHGTNKAASGYLSNHLKSPSVFSGHATSQLDSMSPIWCGQTQWYIMHDHQR